ncbi:MAG TPA: guanylate kinase [Elusimicrobiota bacterium]|nr:guanylate kinase [Elusimicrobiota bacterium]
MKPKSSANDGLLIVISAASGAGKSTLSRELMRRRRKLVFSISVTTRMPRPGETDGRDYFFITENAFKAMRRRGELVEWAVVHGHYYGTPRHFLERMRKAGNDVLLDIDVQGAMAVKRLYPEAVLVFITTPTFADLERRLRRRSSESEAQIRQRLTDGRRELRRLSAYDYEVVNDRVPHAVNQLEAILTAERLRIRDRRTTIRRTR